MSKKVHIDWNNLPAGQSRHPCPLCAKNSKDKSLGVTITREKGIAHCFRCEYVERSDQEARLDSCPIVQKREYATLSKYWCDVWSNCQPLHGAALEYLQARNCVIPPRDGDLRCHTSLKHPNGHVGPALVALITDQITGVSLSIHRTWVSPDGTKPTQPPRLLAGGHRKQGGAIRLWPDEAIAGGLGIAEGIESALSLAHAFQPVWALIDAGNLKKFEPQPGIGALTIAGDRDPAGVRAAQACAHAWSVAGAEVRIVMADNDKNDINDMAEAA